MANLPQYPSPPGSRNHTVHTLTGPASYTQISVASPPTGGIEVTAAQLGLVSIEWAQGGCSDDGQYGLRAIFDNNPARDVSKVRFEAYVLNTGAQVSGSANLSSRTFRIYAFGL